MRGATATRPRRRWPPSPCWPSGRPGSRAGRSPPPTTMLDGPLEIAVVGPAGADRDALALRRPAAPGRGRRGRRRSARTSERHPAAVRASRGRRPRRGVRLPWVRLRAAGDRRRRPSGARCVARTTVRTWSRIATRAESNFYDGGLPDDAEIRCPGQEPTPRCQWRSCSTVASTATGRTSSCYVASPTPTARSGRSSSAQDRPLQEI